MKRTAICAVTILPSLLVGAASAEQPPPIKLDYVRTGAGFACVMDNGDAQRFVDNGDAPDPCLHIGRLFLGMKRAGIEAVLGPPTKQVAIGERENFAYSLQNDTTGVATTYLVARYAKEGTAVALQLTGRPWNGAWRFSGLTLGDTEQALRDKLGDPMEIRDGAETGTRVWSYAPWTFSFEIRNGAVSSILLWSEGGAK